MIVQNFMKLACLYIASPNKTKYTLEPRIYFSTVDGICLFRKHNGIWGGGGR